MQINNIMEGKNELKDKLDFIGLDLDNIPKFLLMHENLQFVPSNTYSDSEHRIFKYIPIQDIQILISPTNRLNEIKEKYSLARTVDTYLNPQNIEEYTSFLKMLNTVTIESIEEIENIQEQFKEKPPFAVQYNKDYNWQIYYSEYSDKYFMIVTTEDYDYSTFFYMLKEQIKYYKNNEEKLIYVPINLLNYSEEYLRKSELADMENYIWLFTKNWPNIYETYDKEGNIKLQIIGNTYIYKTISSGYKIVLSSKEEAARYYKQLKALFILQTELAYHYHFDTRINENCELELYNGIEKIDYDNILEFINSEYKKVKEQIVVEKNNIGALEKKLEELKQTSSIKDLEYINKQKEIAMYLEYKKTFFGKIKLFLKFKKKKSEPNEQDSIQEENKITENINNVEDVNITQEKEYYTIEDLILLYAKLEKETTYIKNMNSDIHALELKIKNIEKKIENATKYIEEIDNHKKSIFEFWKFVNKDEMLAMEEGNLQESKINNGNLKKIFDYETDFTDLGSQMDRLQRKTITKDAQDSIFLLDSKIRESINMIKNNMDVDIDKLREILNELKELANQKKNLYTIEDFDIFGAVSDNSNKLKTLANKKHRETEKDMLTILNISKNTDIEEFKNRLEKAENLIETSISQVKSTYDMPIYIATSNKEMIDKNGFEIYHIVPQQALKDVIDKCEKINLYKLDIVEGMPLVFYTNIMYYNNFNETLPLGMDVTDKVLIDAAEFEFIPKNMITFKICENLTENEFVDFPTIKTIMLCEYELNQKNRKD